MIDHNRNDLSEVLAPFLRDLDELFVTPSQLRDRWIISAAHLSGIRREGRGPKWLSIGSGTASPRGLIRYPLSAILLAELEGMSGPITCERICIAIATCMDVPVRMRAFLQSRVFDVFAGPMPFATTPSGQLPYPEQMANEPALAAIKRFLDDRFISPPYLSKRWSVSQAHLASLRRSGESITFVRLPTGKKGMGSIRYRVSEVLSAERAGFEGKVPRGGISWSEIQQFVVEYCPEQFRGALLKHARALLAPRLESPEVLRPVAPGLHWSMRGRGRGRPSNTEGQGQ